jgi:ribosome-associated toxin RatA of RatAB toxin-antitoxin module
MRKVCRSALVPYSAREVFVLVDYIQAYPDFLPWGLVAVVHSRSDGVVEATLEVHKGSVSKHFTTRNRLAQFESISIELLGGPFRHLSGGWQFKSLNEQGCKVTLDLEFEFSSLIVDMMFGAYFEDTCSSLVEAFTQRAAEVFGKRS